jgi:alkanesulfonate monooxygenase SsuD/methylene tetrahydromethanopterin reductase-like flavin-dependent oxidoreductase (luciferase family)
MHVAPTSQGARETFYQHYAHYLADQSRGRFRVSREAYELAASPRGALYVGSPQEIIDKALAQHELFGHSRILGRMDIGALPYPALSRSVELFANEVAPALRKATADEADDAAAVSG